VRNTSRLAQSVTEYGLMDQIDWGTPATRDSAERGFLRSTPEASASIDSRFEIDRVIGSLRLMHQPRDWLTQRLTIGADIGDETSSTLFPRQPEGAYCFFEALCLGDKTLDQYRVNYHTVDYSVSGAARVAGPLRLITSFGAQYYGKTVTTRQVQCDEFPIPAVTSCSGGVGSEDRFENKTVGVYAQQQFGWNNRIFLTGALRVDDNSAFGANFDVRDNIYPKLAATWVVHEEPFWQSVTWVSGLKLRASWGRAGQQPHVFAAERSFVPVPGGTVTPINVGNPDLKPERATELEVGFDAGLWRDRVAVAFTYFARRTQDAMVPSYEPPSAGFPGAKLVNLGTIRNSGQELALGVLVLQRPAVSWDLGLTLSLNDSRVESLGGLPPVGASRFGDVQQHREGYPVGALFGRQIIHADRGPDGGPVNILCAGGPNTHSWAVIGNRLVRALPCDEAPELYLGRPTPRWEGSLRTSVTVLGNLRLYAQVDFKGGHVVRNGAIGPRITSQNFANARALYDSSDIILLAYEEVRGLDGLVPNLMKGGFAKLREISLTYTLPAGWAAGLRASRGTITVAGRNLATLWVAQREIFGVKVLDPEQRFGSEDTEISNFVRATLPQLTQLVVTVRLTL
jgi:hypothetical protein